MPPEPSSGRATVATLLRDARLRLPGDEAAIEAGHLLCDVLDRNQAWLFAHADTAVEPALVRRFEQLVEARVAGRPIAQLLGRRGFWTFDLEVTADTLIPRPETELLVEAALQRLPTDRPLRIADLGTGTGAIALALALERPGASVVATDFSDAALAVARRNAEQHRIANIQFRRGSWYEPIADMQFELIASNPPYIADLDPHLECGDLRFEPRTALASGRDGLDAIRQISVGAVDHLSAGGWLLLEHGWEQGAAVRLLLSAAGLVDVESLRDLEQRDRVTVGRKPR